MSKLTMKSTKEEILKAYQAAEEQLKQRSAVLSTPENEAATTKAKKVIEDAAGDVAAGIFSPEMNAKFENLQAAIKQEETYLETCYGVKAALIDMTVAINARKQAMMDLDAEMAQITAAAEAKKAALEAAYQQSKTALEQARKREEEEYKYNLERTHKQDADTYMDEMTDLTKKRNAAKAELLALQEEIADIQAMRSRLESIEGEMTEAYNLGVSDGKKEAGKEYGYKSQLTQKDHDYELRERDGKISRLEAENAEKTAKIAALEDKLDAAYTQLRDLATKTVESSGGLKVISTGSDSGSGRK